MEPLRGEAEGNLVRQNESKTIPQHAILFDPTSNTDGNLEESKSTAPKLIPITGRVSRAKKGVPMHICDICKPPKTFTRAEHLRRHQLSHKSAPYGCKYPGCEKVFHRADLLTRHIQRHEQSPTPPYPFAQLQQRSPNFSTSLPTSSGTFENLSTPFSLDSWFFSSDGVSGTQDTFPYHIDNTTDSGYSSRYSSGVSAALPSINPPGSVAYPSISDHGSYTPGSDVSSFRHGRLDKFITEVAEEVAAGLPRSISAHLLPDLSINLPQLLQAFAGRYGHMNASKVDSRLMRLVYKYRFQISNSITSAFEKEEDYNLAIDQSIHNDNMALGEKISFWESKESIEGSDSNGNFDYLPELQEYRDAMLNSPAYSWLISAVLKVLHLETTQSHTTVQNIRQRQILTTLVDDDENVMEQSSRTYFVTFRAPRLALDRMESVQALPQTIVLVGKENHSFATTCHEYSRLVWPESGPQILSLFASLGQNNTNTYTCRLFDDSEVIINISEKDFMVVAVSGSIYSITEVGDQLAWLVTALKPSCRCPGQLCITSSEPLWVRTSNSLHFELDYLPHSHLPSSGYSLDDMTRQGRCWASLFGQLTLVNGYQIPRRAEPETGIEMPLPTMAALANSQKVNVFLGKFLIKGYSTALIPTRRCDEFIYWHVVSNENGDHLGLNDHRIKRLFRHYPSGLTLGDLEFGRHIVGWCTNARNNTGTPNANYSITWSRLGPPTAGLALEKISIVGGMFITGGASVLVGKKDKAIQLRSRDDYTMRLKWISKKYVVLYDVGDRRAWLVDGLSAILHLLRASLNYDLQDPFKSLYLYDPSVLKEAVGVEAGKHSAIQVLTNPENLKIPLYAKPESAKEEVTTNSTGAQTRILSRTKSNYCLKDRIDSLCDVLEQIMACQTDIADQDGVGFKLRFTPRRHLEGFDFMDIAADEDPIRPRMIDLRSSGRGWVDFTRALHAITLFGRGFGELIQPFTSKVSTQNLCNSCVGVAKGQDHLAVSVCDLQDILQKRGSTSTTPWRLIDNIYWHSPDKSFEPCSSTAQASTKHDRVQVLLPATFPKLWGRNLKSPQNLKLTPMGAVIFGHNTRFPLRWGDRGDPDEGQPDQELEELESYVHDSGIGTSLASPGPGMSDGSSSQSFRSPFQNTITPAEGRVSEEEQPVKKRRLWKEISSIGSSSGLCSTQGEISLPNEAPERQTSIFLNPIPAWRKRKSS
ncbi:hypothetical protein F4680DRAFT_426828 [Xylaria scruposa]|nr:hypothetical protein F4680DRAFT_426828 [Xylaria scruposa]